MWASSVSRAVAIAAAIAVFVAASVWPLAHMVISALINGMTKDGGYAALLLDERQRRLLYSTAILGVGTAALASAIGAPLGVALARVDFPWKRTFRVLLAAPMLLPPYVAGLVWVSLSTPTYGMLGAVLVLSLVFYPMSMLATEAAVRRIEPRLEEAALVVASPRRVLWHITLRLAAPSSMAAALVIFVLAVSEFGVPGLLQVRVFTTEVFTAFAAQYDFDRAVILALPLLLLSTVVAGIAVAMTGERLVTTRRGGASADTPLLQSWTAVAVTAAALVVTVALVVPLVVLLGEGRAIRSWSSVLQGASTAVRNSLLFATIGATLTTGIGVALGYARARARPTTGFLADITFVVLFSVPSTVVGIGLISVWNQPGLLASVYGTDAMLVLAYMARLLPVAALGMAAAVRQVPTSHEEAAATAGAGWARTMAHIVVPQVSIGIIAVWVLVFVLAFGELGTSILVAPPGEATLPIRIYTLIANAPRAHLAALSLFQAAVILSPLILLAWGIAARDTR